jgi:hypothetical protein
MTTVITLDTAPFIADLDALAQRQIPFAAMKATNDVALVFQTREIAQLHEVFTIRRAQWADRSIKITQFAKKTDLTATVAVRAPGDASRSDILGKFENWTTKTGRDGGDVAVPVQVRRSGADIIRANERPRSFHFTLEGSANGDTVYRGDRGAVLIKRPGKEGIILQRIRKVGKRGPVPRAAHVSRQAEQAGRDPNVRVLYTLHPRVRIAKRLTFVQNATQAAQRTFGDLFKARLAEALKTARA